MVCLLISIFFGQTHTKYSAFRPIFVNTHSLSIYFDKSVFHFANFYHIHFNWFSMESYNECAFKRFCRHE